MYYKVEVNGNVVDVLDKIVYIRHQKKHDILLLCEIEVAEAILSSTGNYGWHIEGLRNFEPDPTNYTITQIGKREYDTYVKLLKGDDKICL